MGGILKDASKSTVYVEDIKPREHCEDNYETKDSILKFGDIIAPKTLNEDIGVSATHSAVSERLEVVKASLLSGRQSQCPCTRPWSRYREINKPLHVLIPISGTVSKRYPARCSLHSPPSHTMTWLPPRWLKTRLVRLGTSWSTRHRPQFSFQTMRCIPDNSVCFEAAKSGEVQKIKDLVASGKCRLEDIAMTTGYTMLDLAVSRRQAHIVEFLVTTGADPYHNIYGNQPSPCHFAWDLWLRGLIPKEDEHMWRPILDKCDYLDDLKLPVVHKIVLKLSAKDLIDEILLNPEAINDQDNQGRTALSWAAACGRLECLSILLDAGAETNIADKHSKTPLYLALEYQREDTFEIMDKLLNAGAVPDPYLPHPKRSTPLLCAVKNVKDLRVTDLLLRCGANIHAKDRFGKTVLHIVARNKPAKHAALLLSYGARIHVKDRNGDTALNIAIRHGNIDVLQFLILIFYPSNSFNLHGGTRLLQSHFRRIVTQWEHGESPQAFLTPDDHYCAPPNPAFSTVNPRDAKEAKKQLRREYGIRSDFTSDELFNNLNYRRRMYVMDGSDKYDDIKKHGKGENDTQSCDTNDD